jgi:hypothetical protein
MPTGVPVLKYKVSQVLTTQSIDKVGVSSGVLYTSMKWTSCMQHGKEAESVWLKMQTAQSRGGVIEPAGMSVLKYEICQV